MKSIIVLLFVTLSSATLFQDIEYSSIDTPDLIPLIMIAVALIMIGGVTVGSIMSNNMAKSAEEDAILYRSAKL